MKKLINILVFSLIWIFNTQTLYATDAYPVQIEFVQPVIKETPYHRPYVAIWLETIDRKGITTIALWYGERAEDDKWLKDLRQWWRKIGRKNQTTQHQHNVDGYTGATKLTGKHIILWGGKDDTDKPVLAGDYLINIEAAREDGGRDYIRQKITLGTAGSANLPSKREIGPVSIRWK